MTTDPFARRILEHIADRRYRPTQVRALGEELGIAPDELDDFRRTITRMVEDGNLVLGVSDTVALPPPGREAAGVFRLNDRGFGFITPDSPMAHGDLFVPAGQTGGALTGDRVRARVVHEPGRASSGGGAASGRSPYTGRIIEIVQRADRHFVGNLQRVGSQYVVAVDGTAFREPVVVRDPHAKNAKPGDKVVIELIDYPSEFRPAAGVITEVLGESGEPDAETLGVMRAYDLRDRFTEPVLLEARAAASGFDEHAVPPNREDLTNRFILTIDPPDAKDYDDAISIERLAPPLPLGEGKGEGGRATAPGIATGSAAVWELGVHIAHVSHFVRPGGALDEEARRRGNSAYLPKRVVPMLPELLSNGVCSLQEGVNRYCLSVFLRYDRQGRVVGQRFARTVIRSSKRLTYLEAQALIDNDLREAIKHAKTEPKYPRKLIETLKQMNELALVIQQRRLGEGMIVLGLPQVELVFDESGRVTDAVPEDDSFTHKLVEMFMVEANEAAARVFSNFNVPMIRRIHADPPVHDMTELRQFARVAGINIPARPTRRELQALLDGVRGKPAQYAVHLAVLQTLSRAEYSPLLIGHFALASEHYTHFTSPIRRYPDLIIHRGLDAYLDAQAAARRHGQTEREIGRLLRADPRLPDEDHLTELGRHCSATERNAAAAESELRTYLVLDLLSNHLGDDFEGVVTGVTSHGIFVQLTRYLIDGFVRADDLPAEPSDTWRLNRVTGALVAQRSGMSITIGDRFMVRVAKVDPARRKMDLVIVGARGTPFQPKPRRQPLGARKAHEQAMRLKRQRKRDRRKRGG
jgi:ribonuclease R